MARPQKCRNVCREPEYSYFIPDGIACSGNVILSVDEYETIRLMDRERKTHEEAARQMGISRTTVTEIYENARRKIAESIVDGKILVISGGITVSVEEDQKTDAVKAADIGYVSKTKSSILSLMRKEAIL